MCVSEKYKTKSLGKSTRVAGNTKTGKTPKISRICHKRECYCEEGRTGSLKKEKKKRV